MSDARGCGANFYFDGVGRLLAEDYFPCSTTDQALYSAPTADTLPSGDKLPASSAAGIEVLYTYDAYVPPAQSGLAFDTAVCDPSNGVTAPVQFSKGRLVRVSDLGAESYTVYDGRGRSTCATTRLTKPYAPTSTVAVPTFANRYAPRWYSKQFTYDAADRVVDETTGARMLLGANNKSFVKTVYGPRGTVKQVQSAYGDLIAAIDRTADGLVTRVEYADLPHTATTYTFDDRRRVHTAVTARAPPSQWPADFETNTNGSYPLLLQDETFTYDVVGNPVTITDNRIPEEWPAGSKPVSRSFAYDDLYRVIKADYQYAAGDDTWKSPFEAELADATGAGDPRRAEPSPHVSFAKRILWQSYQYDWLGNTRTSNDDAKGFYDRSLGTITNGTTKAYQLTGASNTALSPPPNPGKTGSLSTIYDPAGNLTQLQVTRNGTCAGSSNPGCHQSFLYSWDEVGRLVRARRWDQTTVPANLASPVVDLQYHYAAGDSRVLKTARAGSQEVHTAYIFPSLELRRAQFNTATAGDYTLTSTTEVGYLFANGVRLARLAQQPLDSAGDSNLLRVFFELGDHLGSTSVVLDKGTGELVERDTYQVYGGTESSYRPSTWSSFREDYRFTGKEEDVEVGLTYFGKRFYNALLQRWVSPDPLEVHEVGSGEPNVYAYVSGKALQDTDPLGLCPKCNEIASAEAGQFNRAVAPLRQTIKSLDKEIQTRTGEANALTQTAAAAEQAGEVERARAATAQRNSLLGEVDVLTVIRQSLRDDLTDLELVHNARQDYLKQPMMFGDGSSSSAFKLDIDAFVAKLEYQANGGALATLPPMVPGRTSSFRAAVGRYVTMLRGTTNRGPGSSRANFATPAKLESHYTAHGGEFGSKSAEDYLGQARHVMMTGMEVTYPYKGEQRVGFVSFMRTSKGVAKFAFVGTNTDGKITTFHTESGKTFWKMMSGDPKDKTISPANP